MSATIDGTADFVDDYTYDSQGRVVSVVEHGVSGGNAVAQKQIDMAYNTAGQLVSIARYLDNELVVMADYSYDAYDRLIGLVYRQGDTVLTQYAWTYSDEGEAILASSPTSIAWQPTGGLMPITDTTGVTAALLSGGYSNLLSQLTSCTSSDGTVSYTYDATGQLTAAEYSDDTLPDEVYSYDANGNRTTDGTVTGADNRLLSDGTYAYLYDAEGNRTARFIDVNTNGLLDAGDTTITEYAWDARNRLDTVTDRPAFGSDPTQVVDYLYDTEDRWIGRDIDLDADGIIDQMTRFAYNGTQIILQFDNETDADLTPSDLSHRYLWTPSAVDHLMADEQLETLSTPGDVILPLTDHLGTIRDLAVYDPSTYTTTVATHRTYDSYGTLLTESGSIDCLFGFTGRPFDETTDLQNNWHRWYDTITGRWMSQDPIGFEGKDANLYRYVGNMPLSFVDPIGCVPDENFWHPRYQRPPGTPAERTTTKNEEVTVLQGGQDITYPLSMGVFLFKHMVSQLSYKDANEIRSQVSPLWYEKLGAGTWDIAELQYAGRPGLMDCFAQTDPVPENEFAKGTVTVFGQVYWAAEVNYVLWGAFHDACEKKYPRFSKVFRYPREEEFQQATYLLGQYRNAAYFLRNFESKGLPERRSRGTGVEGRKVWTKIGFDEDITLASPFQLNGERDNEPRICTPSKQTYMGPLTFYVGPNGQNNGSDGVGMTIRMVMDGGKAKYVVSMCHIQGYSGAGSLKIAEDFLKELGLLYEGSEETE